MIKLFINIFLLSFLTSCQLKDDNLISDFIVNKNEIINKEVVKKIDKITKRVILKKNKGHIKKEIIDNKTETKKYNNIKYIIGDPYFIEGVEYIPTENYTYSKIGFATFYGKELHNKLTINSDLNKVTELLGRHKTLPLPSIVKVTNLENGLSVIIKINDRHNDNSSIIQVSRKTAQLLRFYRAKITKVRVDILSDPSQQMKLVTQSMNEITFNDTVKSSPTEFVTISNLDDNNIFEKNSDIYISQPIEIGFEKIIPKDLYLKIYNFNSYAEINNIITTLNITNKFISENEGKSYSVILGPLENIEANNLVLSFISKGYKKTELILK